VVFPDERAVPLGLVFARRSTSPRFERGAFRVNSMQPVIGISEDWRPL
jgi:hypothetical protein